MIVLWPLLPGNVFEWRKGTVTTTGLQQKYPDTRQMATSSAMHGTVQRFIPKAGFERERSATMTIWRAAKEEDGRAGATFHGHFALFLPTWNITVPKLE